MVRLHLRHAWNEMIIPTELGPRLETAGLDEKWKNFPFFSILITSTNVHLLETGTVLSQNSKLIKIWLSSGCSLQLDHKESRSTCVLFSGVSVALKSKWH